MKTLLILLVTSCLIYSCTDSAKEKAQGSCEFISCLRPDKDIWKLSDNYQDTMEFIGYEDEYENGYAVFKTLNNEMVYFLHDESIATSEIHNLCLVNWELDSLLGQDGLYYYDERLVEYSVIEEITGFEEYLPHFMLAYSNETNLHMANFVHERIGFYTTYDDGLYCKVKQLNIPNVKKFASDDFLFLEEELLGNHCDGFPHIQNGAYFKTITYDDVPGYDSPIDQKMKTFYYPLNDEFYNNEFKKVTCILDEQQYSILYFMKLKGQWYLWAEDLCN
jgi:hypothetical protein